MTLRAARARLVATSALGLGIGLVLVAATLISRRFIEEPGSRSRPPLLRPAAVFAPTLLRDVAGPREIDAVTGQAFAPANPTAAPPASEAVPAHAPQPVPEELLLALAPKTLGPDEEPGGHDDSAAQDAADTPAPKLSRPAPADPTARPSAKTPEPRLELIDDNLWTP
jgi:hypothetical protein